MKTTADRDLADIRTESEYASTSGYKDDLAATRLLWSAPGVLETAGSLTLLTYFALPSLLAVQVTGPGGEPRLAIDGHRERTFLAGLLGLADDPRLTGGIRNPAVRQIARALAARHRAYPGMTAPSMQFVGGLLAVAPLRVRGIRPLHDYRLVRGYWRYVQHAMPLVDAPLGHLPSVIRSVARFARAGAGHSSLGDELIRGYADRHPVHVARAVPVLHPGVRRVVEATLAGAA